jgi:hypothetical protein
VFARNGGNNGNNGDNAGADGNDGGDNNVGRGVAFALIKRHGGGLQRAL